MVERQDRELLHAQTDPSCSSVGSLRKLCPLIFFNFAHHQKLQAIPTSSPTHSGYIEWQAKRGKWSKRWVQLKEHSLWISKRDNVYVKRSIYLTCLLTTNQYLQGKDETLLCSLSNFDVYHATRPHRAPKPFTFTVKSTEKLSLFENTDDYMHTFSCSERDGNIWMEKILVARVSNFFSVSSTGLMFATSNFSPTCSIKNDISSLDLRPVATTRQVPMLSLVPGRGKCRQLIALYSRSSIYHPSK